MKEIKKEEGCITIMKKVKNEIKDRGFAIKLTLQMTVVSW